MNFDLYLVKKRVISAEQLVRAIELQHARYVRIGQLAIEERMMSARDVFHVLQYQRDTVHLHERFGEIAVEMGLLTEQQLQRLLLLQLDRKPPLSDVLIRLGYLTPEQAECELAKFRDELDGRKEVTTRRLQTARPQVGAVPHLPTDAGILEEAELYTLMS